MRKKKKYRTIYVMVKTQSINLFVLLAICKFYYPVLKKWHYQGHDIIGQVSSKISTDETSQASKCSAWVVHVLTVEVFSNHICCQHEDLKFKKISMLKRPIAL